MEMLVFFDETFRTSIKHNDVSLGALCGIGIPDRDLGRVADDVFKLKLKHLGSDFARNKEIKGKELLKEWVFRLQSKGIPSKNLSLAFDLVEYIATRKLPVFGCVCFDKGLQRFHVNDVAALDKTFRYLFERVDMFMKIYRPQETASLVFDDRDYSINCKNSEAITNFFQRSAHGLTMDTIVKTPFFAISQANNIGLQLADLVTTIIGLRFSSHQGIEPFFGKLKHSIISWRDSENHSISTLKVMRGDIKKERARRP